MTAEAIARQLGGRRCGASWLARCPAHEDHTPSLGLRDAAGRVLVRCYAGCQQGDVLDALRSRGLWLPSRGSANLRGAARAASARQQASDRRDTPLARWFGRAARVLAEEVLASLPPAHHDRARLTDVLRALRSELLAEYRHWRAAHPALAAAMVVAGRASDAAAQRSLAALFGVEGVNAEAA